MELTDFTLRLLVLFLPGILAFLLVDSLTAHRPYRTYELILLPFIAGVVSYVLYGLLLAVCLVVANRGLDWRNIGSETFRPIEQLTGRTPEQLAFGETACASAIGFLIGVAWAANVNRSWLRTAFRRIAVTRKFNDPNVWSMVLNSPNVQWANVRDLEQGRMYQGFIRAYSEEEPVVELFLTDVVVYDEKSGRELYRADSIYFSRPPGAVTVEFPVTSTDSRGSHKWTSRCRILRRFRRNSPKG